MKFYAKKTKKIALFLILVIFFTSMPLTKAQAGSLGMGYQSHEFNVTIDYYGSDPTDIDLIIGEIDANSLLYTFNLPAPYIPVCTLPIRTNDGHFTYEGNGRWEYSNTFTINKKYTTFDHIFVGVSLDTVRDKWYVDKWDSNNAIYQPGSYESTAYTTINSKYILTSSASTENSIVVNKSWSAGTTPVGTTLKLYRYYSINNSYELVKQADVPSNQAGYTFSGLYAGKYYVQEVMPAHYSSDQNGDRPAEVGGNSAYVELNSPTTGSASFINT